ncbi:MAG: hypothetical protein ABI697_04595 [Devosia sp.]
MPARKLLFISNGHGEDAIAAEIVRRLPAELEAAAYPMLGDGSAYTGLCDIVGPRARLPSEGWRNVRGSVAADIRGGRIGAVWDGMRFLRDARTRYDRAVVVGDMFGVYAAWLAGHRGIAYLDVYKTGFGGPYLWFDKRLLRATAKTVFCRSQSLADALVIAGVDARFAGNLMLDTIPRRSLRLERSRPLALTILPGSRRHALDNFRLQVEALGALPAALMPDLFLAVASAIGAQPLAEASGLALVPGAGLGRLIGRGLDIALVPGDAMGDALDQSDLVLSQAGTATVQAIGLGRPAITFQNADDRASRFADENRLFGDARQVVRADATAIAAKLAALLSDPAERDRLADIGRVRVGPPGALAAIIEELRQ